jgi:hypothetical protein
MVTIYNGNLGLVKDTRDARLGAGTLEVRFMNVAAQIDPTSVHLRSVNDPPGLKILEQNYEDDLLTSEKLMEKYVGKKVRLYQSGGVFQEATLLSTNGPVWDINGEIHMGGYGNVVLPALPENRVSPSRSSSRCPATGRCYDRASRTRRWTPSRCASGSPSPRTARPS